MQVYLANTVLYYAEVPGVAQTQIFSFTAVAYEGEDIGAYMSNGGCHITISGYLFSDLAGPGVPHGTFDRHLGPPAPPEIERPAPT